MDAIILALLVVHLVARTVAAVEQFRAAQIRWVPPPPRNALPQYRMERPRLPAHLPEGVNEYGELE